MLKIIADRIFVEKLMILGFVDMKFWATLNS